jgi:hypothetical protein
MFVLLHFTMFSLDARFENYELLISLIFNFFFGPRETADTESVYTVARLYLVAPLAPR